MLKKQFFIVLMLIILSACTKKITETVSFSSDVQPIIDRYCLECHTKDGAGYVASGLDMSAYESLMKGTRLGPIIQSGSSTASTLVVLIEGRADPSINMPHGRDTLSKEEKTTIKKWIDQGAQNN